MATKEKINVDHLRKIVECAMQKFGTNMILLISKKEAAGVQNKTEQEATRSQHTTKEAKKPRTTLRISPYDGQTFASVLKEIKKNIDIEEMGVEIERIHQLKNGDLQMKIKEKSKGAIDHFKKSTEGALKDKATTKMSNEHRKSVLIKNIVNNTTEEDILGAISLVTDDRTIKIHSLKANRDGSSMNAIVSANLDSANTLIMLQKIKIGWVRCNIKEIVDLKQCTKCKRYGHNTRTCTYTHKDLQGKCYKCSQEGHIAKNCNNEQFCYICETAGHVASSYRCPIYRNTVMKLSESNNRQTHIKQTDTDKTNAQ